MHWDVLLERRTQNRLNEDVTKKKLRHIAAAAERNKAFNFRARVSKWSEPVEILGEDQQPQYLYRMKIRLEKVNVRSTDAANKQYERILGVATKSANRHQWQVVDGSYSPGVEEGSEKEALEPIVEPRPVFQLPDLTEDAILRHFSGVYERDAHIRLVHDSMKTYSKTGGATRSHILLHGLPAGCKTTLFKRFKSFYEEGSEVERVVMVDGPTMSKAGLENWLLDLAESGLLPEVVIIEEIEKQNMDNLLTLLSLMGSGYISKMNARVGKREALANCAIWATCNDSSLLKGFRNGALWSRFTHKLHCKRPGRDLMLKILLRQVDELGGKHEWADKAIEFAYETIPSIFSKPWDDPREIIGLLDGGDRLLDKSYQKDKLEVIKSEVDELAMMNAQETTTTWGAK